MKPWKKILIRALAILIVLLLACASITGYKYYKVTHSGAKAEMLSGPAFQTGDAPLPLGEKMNLITLFRVPWGIRPITLNAGLPQGCQFTGEPYFIRKKTFWGWNLWQGMIPLQAYREGKIKGKRAEATFSNAQIIELTTPDFEVKAPELKGYQLEIAGELDYHAKKVYSKIWLWIIPGIIVLLLILLIYLRMRRAKRDRMLTPWEKAMAAIHDLMDKIRAGNIQPENSVVRLTDIVRDYLEQRFALRAGRQTTAEFLSDLESGRNELNENQRGFLREFLTAADMVKFAKLPADRTLIENAAGKAGELIRETTPDEAGKENRK